MHEDAQEIEHLLRGPRSAGENDDAVGCAHEGFQALFDVRQDGEAVDQGVWGLGGDDARFREAQVTAFAVPLLGMAHGSALHGTLHGTGAAARADVEAAKAEFIAHKLAVVVLRPGNGMATPAHGKIGFRGRLEDVGMAQGVEHRIGDTGAAREVEGVRVRQGFREVDHVPEHGKEELLDPLYHAAVNEGPGRCLEQFELNAPGALEHLGAEVRVALEESGGVVAVVAAVEHGEAAAAEELPGFPLFKALHQVRFKLGEQLQGAPGADAGSGDVLLWDFGGAHGVRVSRAWVIRASAT